jgi:hypothetical protein
MVTFGTKATSLPCAHWGPKVIYLCLDTHNVCLDLNESLNYLSFPQEWPENDPCSPSQKLFWERPLQLNHKMPPKLALCWWRGSFLLHPLPAFLQLKHSSFFFFFLPTNIRQKHMTYSRSLLSSSRFWRISPPCSVNCYTSLRGST